MRTLCARSWFVIWLIFFPSFSLCNFSFLLLISNETKNVRGKHKIKWIINVVSVTRNEHKLLFYKQHTHTLFFLKKCGGHIMSTCKDRTKRNININATLDVDWSISKWKWKWKPKKNSNLKNHWKRCVLMWHWSLRFMSWAIKTNGICSVGKMRWNAADRRQHRVTICRNKWDNDGKENKSAPLSINIEIVLLRWYLVCVTFQLCVCVQRFCFSGTFFFYVSVAGCQSQLEFD